VRVRVRVFDRGYMHVVGVCECVYVRVYAMTYKTFCLAPRLIF